MSGIKLGAFCMSSRCFRTEPQLFLAFDSMMYGSHNNIQTRLAQMERNLPCGCSIYCFFCQLLWAFHPSQRLPSLAWSPFIRNVMFIRLEREQTKEVAVFLWPPPLSFRGMQVGKQCWWPWYIIAEKGRTPISNKESGSCYSQQQTSAHAGSSSQASVWIGPELVCINILV